MKRTLLIIPLIIALLLTGCSASSRAPEKQEDEVKQRDYNFIFVCPITSSEYWKECIAGIEQADRELGTTTRVIGPESSEHFATVTLGYMKEAVSQKPDGIIAYAGIDGFLPLINQATEQGTPVIALDSDSPDSSRIAYVGTDSYNAGFEAGGKMIELTGGKAKVGILVSSKSAEKEMDVVSAFYDTVQDYEISVVAVEETNEDADTAEQKATRMLTEHPEIEAILSTTGYNAAGAARAKKALGRDDLVIIGFDDIEENLKLVREGIINAILVQKIRLAGYQSVYLMKEYIDKGFLAKNTYDSGTITVTKDNVDNYDSPTHSTNTENKLVKVGYYKGDTGFQDGFSDEERKSGYAYEYLQSIASIAGWNYKYYYGSRAEIISLLKLGKIDVAAGIYKTDAFDGKLLFSDYEMGTGGIECYFAVSPGRQDLLDDLNMAMEQIAQVSPDFTASLFQKYYNKSALELLNDEEKEWLNDKKLLRLGYIPHNMPISDIDKDGKPTGVVKELISLMKDYLHIEIEPVCFENIGALQQGLLDGQADVIFPLYSDLWYSEQMGMCQTESFINDKVMIVYKGSYSSDLFNRIAISETGIGQKYYLETYYPNADIIYYESKEKALEAIQKDKEKCLTACSSILQHFLRENPEYQDLNVAYLDASENFSMAVRNDNNLLLGILNKTIRHADNAVITSAMVKYSDVNNEYSLNDIIRRYSSLFVGVLSVFIAILLLLFIAYQRRTHLYNAEQKKIKEALEVALDEANAASRAKTNFLSSMSHDIRTPMNAIIGMTSIAHKNIDNRSKLDECLDKIELSGRHLLTLINNVLDISKIESGKLQLNPSAFSLGKAMETIIEIVQPQIKQKELEFVTEVDKLSVDLVYADEVRINQIFMNILTNAIKYTPNRGRVCMSLVQEPAANDGDIRLIYTVEDNGIGMSEEFMKNMYDSFSRAKDSRIDRIQGTGLGLAIVKQMVDMMNGEISCESEEGKGTKFIIKIDVPAVANDDTVEGIDFDEQTDVAEATDGSVLNNINVLVAEDNDLNWEVASELLGIYGITTERAENGQICVDMLSAAEPGTYNLVLMDIQMPVMNGRDAARAIRADERDYINSIPIIAMTADAFAEDILASLEAGMNGHVSKPIDINKLFQEIVKAINEKN